MHAINININDGQYTIIIITIIIIYIPSVSIFFSLIFIFISHSFSLSFLFLSLLHLPACLIFFLHLDSPPSSSPITIGPSIPTHRHRHHHVFEKALQTIAVSSGREKKKPGERERHNS
jgi:hypothetical protein